MLDFIEYLNIAITYGRGRRGTRRQIPLFVPEGRDQDELHERAIKYLKNSGFKLMRVDKKSYEEAINEFDLGWPDLQGKWPNEEFEVKVDESESKLLIVCGKESHPLFWKFLERESILYTGHVLPPIKQLSSRCIVVPDSACVAVIIKHKDFYQHFPRQYFGPINTFNSNEAPF